ncbi:MAG: hypothetical protein K6F63_07735 [Lachnospiraceae bacterium]|nr:hypothetical protein [Lachnospiraceae bacterium]
MANKPVIRSGISPVNAFVNPVLEENFTPNVESSANPMQVAVGVAGNIWLTGIAVMSLYAFISLIRIRRLTREVVIPLKSRNKPCLFSKQKC